MPGSVPLTQPGNQRGLLQSVFKAGDGAVDQTGHNQQLARLHLVIASTGGKLQPDEARTGKPSALSSRQRNTADPLAAA